MKFKINRTSDRKPNVGETAIKKSEFVHSSLYEIEINTLEELLAIKDKAQEELIIKRPILDDDKYEYEIEIYDDYRE